MKDFEIDLKIFLSYFRKIHFLNLMGSEMVVIDVETSYFSYFFGGRMCVGVKHVCDYLCPSKTDLSKTMFHLWHSNLKKYLII